MNKIINSDAMSGLSNLDSGTVKLIAIDPPYTDGITDVLPGHKIQTKLDIQSLSNEFYRVAEDNSFYAVFGLMPTIAAWHIAAISAGFKFTEHIVWAKRMITSPYLPLQRTFENIYIYRKGKPKYVDTVGKYEDLKINHLELGLVDMSSIKGIISDLNRRLLDREYDRLYFSKIPMKNGNKSKTNDAIYKDWYEAKNKRPKDDLDYYCEEHNLEKTEREDHVPTGSEAEKGFVYRSRRYVNITNLWSFTPHNQQRYGSNEFNVKHPTVKPVQLLERLIKLCTNENELVLDCFMGSGTTAIAAIRSKRNYIGVELDSEYCELANKRISIEIDKEKGKLF